MIGMHRYAVGGWYPFRDANARIEDPKTSAAVGAMLCALAEGRLESFLMRTSQLAMKSTARFIGRMEISGQIREQGVLLSEVDLEKRPASSDGVEFTMTFAAPPFSASGNCRSNAGRPRRSTRWNSPIPRACPHGAAAARQD